MADCINAFGMKSIVNDWYSPVLQKKTIAYKQHRLATFPDYLIIQLKRFIVSDTWQPIKLGNNFKIYNNL